MDKIPSFKIGQVGMIVKDAEKTSKNIAKLFGLKEAPYEIIGEYEQRVRERTADLERFYHAAYQPQQTTVVVVGGLLSSTLLTLLLVPVVYSYVDGLRVRVPALFRRVRWARWMPWVAAPGGSSLKMSTP